MSRACEALRCCRRLCYFWMLPERNITSLVGHDLRFNSLSTQRMADALARGTWDGAEIILVGNLHRSRMHHSCCHLRGREELRQSKFLLFGTSPAYFLASHWDPVIWSVSTFKPLQGKAKEVILRPNLCLCPGRNWKHSYQGSHQGACYGSQESGAVS